ncbi:MULTISPECIES: transposase [Streptomyces]|uniref:Transposase n=2 Tax=Streptomyces TaxID=1883 RepID=A0ABV9J0Y1_9ACTN
MGERHVVALIDGTHQLVKAPIVLVRDRPGTHVSHTMRELNAEGEWLTEFLLPARSPDLNPVEGVRAHVGRNPDHLAVVALDRMETQLPDQPKSHNAVQFAG